MAELDLSKIKTLETPKAVIETEIQEVPSNNLDFTKIKSITSSDGVDTITTDTIGTKLDLSKTDISKTDKRFILPSEEEPSFWEKISYATDKQNMVFGNLWRIGKAKVQDWADPNRDFKDVIRDNAKEEERALKTAHKKFASGKYDDDWIVQAASMATFMVDPFYLAAYMTPWGRAATLTYKGLATVGGATIGFDKMLDDIATMGEVDWKGTAIATGVGATLGPVAKVAFKTIGKMMPGADKKQLEQVIRVVEGAKKEALGVSTQEFRVLQKIAGNQEFRTLNNQLKIAGKNWSKIPAEIEQKYINRRANIIKELNKLESDKKSRLFLSKMEKKGVTDRISELIAKKKELKTAMIEAQKVAFKKQAKEGYKVADLLGKRETKFLEKLAENKMFHEKAISFTLDWTTRPLMGGAITAAFGQLWGPEDADISDWFWTGVALGAAHKGVMKSKLLTIGQKNLARDVIFRDATKIALQQVRKWTSTTSSSKLAAFGGDTEKLGFMLYETIDSPYSQKSIAGMAQRLYDEWSRASLKIFSGKSKDHVSQAVSIARGSREKATKEVVKTATEIRAYLDRFKKLAADAGIFTKTELKDYFPRVWDWGKIMKNKATQDEFKTTIAGIYKSQGRKNPIKAAEDFFEGIQKGEKSTWGKVTLDDLVTGKANYNEFITTPISDHFTKARILRGKYNQVEKVLEQKGYLVNDGHYVLKNLMNRSVKSIAFARKFGRNGQLLKPYIEGIKKKYAHLPNGDQLARNEIQVVLNSIDGFFDRFGTAQQGMSKSAAGVLSTIANLNMLDRVTIASLGDLVGSFVNSNNFSAWFNGLRLTSWTAKGEKGIARNMNLAEGKELQKSFLSATGVDRDATANLKWMGKAGPTRLINEFGFKAMGLQWLTGFARRFSYNAGAADVYTTSRKLAKYISAGGKMDSRKGLNFIRDLERYGISGTDGLRIGKFTTFEKAIDNKNAVKFLNEAGIAGANRDALIPQASNRLLFTASRNPWTRLAGQFMSWAMAKSTQTNKILTRIENGDVRTMVKLLASIPVYGGIQQLREIAKYGEVVTDLDNEADSWWSESLRLSGMGGIIPELTFGRLYGPASREPWFLISPFTSLITDLGSMSKSYLAGETDRGNRLLLDRFVPFPTWRRWFMKLFGKKIVQPVETNWYTGGQKKKKKYNLGGAVSVEDTAATEDIDMDLIKKDNINDMNKKDIAALATAATLATTGVDADINKAIENNILPAEKSEIVQPVEIAEEKKEIKIFNNPGNIETGQGYAGETGELYAERFSIFDSKEMGIRALAKDLNTKIKRFDGDVEQIISQYAPPNENDTKAYIKFVKAQLNNKDKITKDDLALLTKAVILQENKPEIAELYLLPEVFSKGMDLSTLDLPSTFTFEDAKKAFEKKQKTF